MLTLPVTGAGVCYDAFDNTAAAVYAPEDGMPLRLEAFGVRAFVFGPDNTAQEAVQPRGSVKSCAWRYTISLQDAGGEAWRPLAADSPLFDVTSSRGEPRFSGAIRYETAFEAADTGMPVWLDLGQVGETAEVALNGVPLRGADPGAVPVPAGRPAHRDKPSGDRGAEQSGSPGAGRLFRLSRDAAVRRARPRYSGSNDSGAWPHPAEENRT